MKKASEHPDLFKEEVLQKLIEGKKNDKPSKTKDLKKYIGTSVDFIGLSTPAQQAVFKTGFSSATLPKEEQWKLWDYIWKTSHHFELMNMAQMFASKESKKVTKDEAIRIWNIVRHWVKWVDNWAHSDGLSSIYSRLLELEPELLYEQYAIWNKSSNPWERRQSVVGILYYSSIRKKHLPFSRIEAIIKPLLADDDYFVHKGVGWALREMGNVYPAETLKFINEELHSIHSIAFTASIEKLDAETKTMLKELRKAGKKKKGIVKKSS